MRALQRLNSIQDYDLSEVDIRLILRGDDEDKKAGLAARLLESARYEDIWQCMLLAELRAMFPKLQLKPQVRSAWEFAILVWVTERFSDRYLCLAGLVF